LTDRGVEEKVDAKWERFVNEVVSAICEIIQVTAPDDSEKRDRLTQRASAWLLLRAFNLRSVYTNADRYNHFDTQIDIVVTQKIHNNQLEPVVRDWVWVQAAECLVKMAGAPFSDRLRKHDSPG
jgi:hypothetical protein